MNKAEAEHLLCDNPDNAREAIRQAASRIATLESWIKEASPLIRAVGLDPMPERRRLALKLWESIPVNPFT